jgi:hypothetical protein
VVTFGTPGGHFRYLWRSLSAPLEVTFGTSGGQFRYLFALSVPLEVRIGTLEVTFCTDAKRKTPRDAKRTLVLPPSHFFVCREVSGDFWGTSGDFWGNVWGLLGKRLEASGETSGDFWGNVWGLLGKRLEASGETSVPRRFPRSLQTPL